GLTRRACRGQSKGLERLDEQQHHRWMGIAGLLVGLPPAAAGGTGAVLGWMVVLDGTYLPGDEHSLLLLWSSAG
ncbi:hypothetical protein AAGG60_21945, partial [Stenotrophomonas maltophilia]